MSTVVRRAAWSVLVVSIVAVACSDSPEVPDGSIDATSEGAVDAKSESAVDVTTDVGKDVVEEPAPQDASIDVADDVGDDATQDATQDVSVQDAPQDVAVQDAAQDVITQQDAAIDASDAGGCLTSSDCNIGFYCEKGNGNCSVAGSCMVRPTFCPNIVSPVCGCDNVTYNNACLAHRIGGITVAYAGNCE